MSFRPLLAGPSRASVGALKTPLVRPRRYLTIPHPDLALPQGKRGANRFVISLPTGTKTDMPHAFAYLRAVEGALGTSIISIDVAHDHDDLQPLRFITFTTLYPVEFNEPIWVKMKKPKVEPYDMYGGPSLESVSDAFRKEVELAKDGQDCISFKIEVDTTRRRESSRTAEIKGNARNSRFARTQQDKVLDLLETLGGDWEKVARKYEHLRRETPASAKRNGLDEILASEDGSFADGLDERLDGELVHAQRREAKHRRHAEETAGSEQLGEGENVIAQRRQHSEQAREARHRLRAAREAERQAIIHDAEASAWKFEIGSPEATPTIEQTDAPVDSSAIRFNLPRASRSSRSTSALGSDSAAALAQNATRISAEQARLLVEKKIKERLNAQRPVSSPRPEEPESIEQEPTAEPVETAQKDIPPPETPSAPLAEMPAPAVEARPKKSRKQSRAAEKKVKENKAESEAAPTQPPSRATDSEPLKAGNDEAGIKAGEKETEVESQSQENKEAQQSTKDDGKNRSFWGRLLG